MELWSVPNFLNLVFKRHYGSWGLFVENATGLNALSKASRETRIRAVEKLPALVDLLLENAHGQLEKVGQAMKEATELRDRLRSL